MHWHRLGSQRAIGRTFMEGVSRLATGAAGVRKRLPRTLRDLPKNFPESFHLALKHARPHARRGPRVPTFRTTLQSDTLTVLAIA